MNEAGSSRLPSWKQSRGLAGVACVVIMLAAGPVLASGVVRDSVGATSSGRGGANIAHFDNGPVLLSNPAGIVNIRGPQLFEIGVDAVFTDLDYHDPENNGATDFASSPLPQITYIKTNEDGTWAAGIGVYAPAGFSSDWDLNNPVFGNASYSSFGALVKIIPGVAVHLTDQWSVGATLGLAASRIELTTPFYMQTGILAGAPAVLDLSTDGLAPTWSVGTQYQLTDRTMLGLVYVSECDFTLKGDAAASVVGLTPDPVNSEFDANMDLVWPQSVGAGISQLVGERQRVSADVVWYDWSSAFDRVDLRFTDATNPLVPAVVGPVLHDSFPLGWHDGISIRVGYEFFRTSNDVIRVGYIHNSRNIPSSTLTPLIPATMEHSFTVGYGKNGQTWRTDIAYQYAWGPERQVGTSTLVGGDFNASASTSQAHWIMLSFLK